MNPILSHPLCRIALICSCTLFISLAASAQSKPVTYHVDRTQSIGEIDVNIYGQFLEHIFNSVHGGLWGDMILNPSFEREPAGATWELRDDAITNEKPAKNTPLFFGDEKWTDYEITLEGKVTRGNKSLNIPFRGQGPHTYYMLNYGVAGHRKWSLQRDTDRGESFLVQADKGRAPLEVDTWYELKIRAKGAHIQAWIDGEKLVDFTDKTPLLHGKVGVNCIYSKPTYRNIQVRSLDGKVLFKGLPTPHEMSIRLPYWTQYGPGVLQTMKQVAFNNRDAMVLSATKQGETGIEQGPMRLRKGETYRVSVHLRSPKAGATARLRLVGDSGDAEWTESIGPLTTAWKKHEQSFQCMTDAMSAQIQIGVRHGQTIEVDMASMFSDSALAVGGFRPDLLQMIADEKPANIRYPGGCFASQYRWKDGIGPHEKRIDHAHVIWDDRDSNQMGTDEFIDLCRRVKAEPIIVVNISRGVEEALDWLEYCNGSVETKWGKVRVENGHPKPYNVKYWEIDNETWGMGAKKYSEHVKTFSKSLRAKDPTIEIIACGGCSYDNDKNRTLGWNQTLIDEAATDFDYLSIHYYNGIDIPRDFVDDPTRYENYIRDELAPMIAKSKNPKMLVYCSEWGMMSDGWGSGLYTGGILNGFERLNGLLTMSCPAVWLQKVSQEKPNPRWGSCSIIFDHQTSYGAPMHVTLTLWRESYQPKRLAVQGPKQPLNVVAAMSDDGAIVTFKAVNTGKQAVDVNVVMDGLKKVRSATMQVIAPGSPGATNTLKKPDTVKAASAVATVKANTVGFTLPPYSVGVVTARQ